MHPDSNTCTALHKSFTYLLHFPSATRMCGDWPIKAWGMVIFNQVRLHTLRLELGDATALATVSASVLTVRWTAHATDTSITTIISDICCTMHNVSLLVWPFAFLCHVYPTSSTQTTKFSAITQHESMKGFNTPHHLIGQARVALEGVDWCHILSNLEYSFCVEIEYSLSLSSANMTASRLCNQLISLSNRWSEMQSCRTHNRQLCWINSADKWSDPGDNLHSTCTISTTKCKHPY